MKSNSKWQRISFCFLLVVSSAFISIGCGDNGSDPPGGPRIEVSTREIVNGDVVLNNALDRTITVKNTGSEILYLGSIAQANPLAPPFSIVSGGTDHCSNVSVDVGGTCTFQVRFTPTAQTLYTDSFDIPSNAVNENPVTVSVSGNGKALRVAINQVNTGQCGSGILELLVSVTKNNNSVQSLTAANFLLTENGATKTVNVIESHTAAPISVALLLDYSTSLDSSRTDLLNASSAFVGSLQAGDQAGIIKFAEQAQLMPPGFSNDKDSLTGAIMTDPNSIGNREVTRLYDALWLAIGQIPSTTNNKGIVLFSDGKDEDADFLPNASTHSLDQVITYASQQNVAIFTVGLGAVNGDVMNQLANGTGGQYFSAADSSQLNNIYSTISQLLAGQYLLQYSTSVKGASTLKLNVVSGEDQGVVSRQIQGCPF